jgi:uncharacterized protein YprB with RNaseH-like and TPR domain
MIPQRFVVEYPKRCLALLEMLEPQARRENLVGSFSLLVASAAFVIPYARMQSRHPLHQPEQDSDLSGALRSLDKHEKFLTAKFWDGAGAGDWRFSRIMENQNITAAWRDQSGFHPMSKSAENSIGKSNAGEVLRVVRNALAHGNVVYLDESGFETPGNLVTFLGFLSRYEETEGERASGETYRLVVTTEDNFLRFVRAWAVWIASFPPDMTLVEAA